MKITNISKVIINSPLVAKADKIQKAQIKEWSDKLSVPAVWFVLVTFTSNLAKTSVASVGKKAKF